MKVLHLEALNISKTYRESEHRLIGLLQEIDGCRGYREVGYTSLYLYATGALGLSDAVTYNLITIARKAKQVPALKAAIESGAVTVSNARLIAPVLTLANQDAMIAKATELPKRELERQIANQFPERAIRETTRYVAPERMELRMGITPELEKKLKRAQDLVSQSGQKAATLEETLSAVLDEFLKRKDPIQKADRAEQRKVVRSDGQKLIAQPVRGTAVLNADEMVDVEKDGKIKGPTALLWGQHLYPKPVPGQAIIQAGKAGAKIGVSLVRVGINSRPLGTGSRNSAHSRRISPRKPILAPIKHTVILRDQGRCTTRLQNGQRCEETRWLDFHHKVPVSHGGTDTAENLHLLCRAHHQALHRQ